MGCPTGHAARGARRVPLTGRAGRTAESAARGGTYPAPAGHGVSAVRRARVGSWFLRSRRVCGAPRGT